MIVRKLFKYTGVILLLSLAIVVYNSVYFDIPREKVISKHKNEISEFLELSDGSLIHFRDEGNKSGEVILLVHGFNGSLFNYEPMVPFLIDQYRVISLDLPAHGLTGAVKSDLYSHESFEKVIEEVVDARPVNRQSPSSSLMGVGLGFLKELGYD